jgi:hypothetical protein
MSAPRKIDDLQRQSFTPPLKTFQAIRIAERFNIPIPVALTVATLAFGERAP